MSFFLEFKCPYFIYKLDSERNKKFWEEDIEAYSPSNASVCRLSKARTINVYLISALFLCTISTSTDSE
jgi:hypothetical protein